MRIVRSVAEVRDALAASRPARIGLVPTMGYFHEGHLALMRAARRGCDVVAVSLFVNPTQFGDAADLDAYPRDEARDAALAEAEGVDLLFAPGAEEIYPSGFATSVAVAGVTEILEGDPASRGPEHFSGVTTIVTKLFNIVQPDVAYFGQKDAQQLVVIRRLVRDLDMPVEIAAVPTVRDPDGLALSSRNIYLSAEERQQALSLSRALAAAREAVAHGVVNATDVLAAARHQFDVEGVKPEYVELRSAEDLSPASRVNGSTLLAVAARVGRARLIDNTILGGDPK